MPLPISKFRPDAESETLGATASTASPCLRSFVLAPANKFAHGHLSDEILLVLL